MIVRAPRILELKRYNPANISRSILLSVCFFGDLRGDRSAWELISKCIRRTREHEQGQGKTDLKRFAHFQFASFADDHTAINELGVECPRSEFRVGDDVGFVDASR